MKVEALERFEHVLDMTVKRKRVKGEIFDVDEDRAKLLESHNLVKILDKKEEPKEEPKPKKPRKKK